MPTRSILSVDHGREAAASSRIQNLNLLPTGRASARPEAESQAKASKSR